MVPNLARVGNSVVLKKIVRGEWYCNTCVHRIGEASKFVDRNGKSIVCCENKDRSELQETLHLLCSEEIEQYI